MRASGAQRPTARAMRGRRNPTPARGQAAVARIMSDTLIIAAIDLLLHPDAALLNILEVTFQVALVFGLRVAPRSGRPRRSPAARHVGATSRACAPSDVASPQASGSSVTSHGAAAAHSATGWCANCTSRARLRRARPPAILRGHVAPDALAAQPLLGGAQPSPMRETRDPVVPAPDQRNGRADLYELIGWDPRHVYPAQELIVGRPHTALRSPIHVVLRETPPSGYPTVPARGRDRRPRSAVEAGDAAADAVPAERDPLPSGDPYVSGAFGSVLIRRN